MDNRERDLENHKFAGLQDHSTHILKCSACGQTLLEVKVVKKSPLSLEYQADCPFCGDHSYPVDIQGQIIVGHTGHVVWDGTDIQGRRVRLKTVKVDGK